MEISVYKIKLMTNSANFIRGMGWGSGGIKRTNTGKLFNSQIPWGNVSGKGPLKKKWEDNIRDSQEWTLRAHLGQSR